jgi:Ca-activated chloride channel family protein
MHFLRPAWLLALPVALLLPMAWRRLRRATGDWASVCDEHLLQWLSVGERRQQDGMSYGGWLFGLALALAALALAGPSWQRLPDISFKARDARVLVLDLSRSMLAEDLKPNRLTRARYRLSDLLRNTREGQIGLVAYAGDAYVVTPLTSDTNTVANLLPALRPDVVPVAGSRADRGLELAADLLRRSGQGGGEILLVTDSIEGAAIARAESLTSDGIVTSVLAVGTPGGAPIPSGGGFVSDGAGNVVIARLELQRLRELARAGGGRLTVLGAAAVDELPWRGEQGSDFDQRDDGLGERWKDSGPWLTLALIPLAALVFRRGLLFALVLGLLPLLAPLPAQAGFWDDLWARRDQQARAALDADRAAEAAQLARDPALSGEAWFRAGEYPRAVDSWAGLGDADAHYNRGNALAHAGNLDGAIAAYDQALELEPDMEDALYNKALIEQLRDQQQSDSGEDAQGGEQQNDSSEQGQQQDGEQGESGQEGESGDEQQQGGEQEGSESEVAENELEGQEGQEQLAQAWSEEDAQAMEQWLRRIPDDPGGLLRRKFRSEHQRRGAPPDERETW